MEQSALVAAQIHLGQPSLGASGGRKSGTTVFRCHAVPNVSVAIAMNGRAEICGYLRRPKDSEKSGTKWQVFTGLCATLLSNLQRGTHASVGTTTESLARLRTFAPIVLSLLYCLYVFIHGGEGSRAPCAQIGIRLPARLRFGRRRVTERSESTAGESSAPNWLPRDGIDGSSIGSEYDVVYVRPMCARVGTIAHDRKFAPIVLYVMFLLYLLFLASVVGDGLSLESRGLSHINHRAVTVSVPYS
jgi:hypothetical protein